nr:serine protease [Actinomycetospora corticicola]
MVRDGEPVGTAFVVADGFGATAAHVLKGGVGSTWTFEPLTASGRSFPAKIVGPMDRASDVALVGLPAGEEWEPVPLASHSHARPGDPVHLRGFAGSLDFDSGVGVLVGEVSDGGHVWVKVSCRHAQPGMSGAPVLLTGTGCAIGLVSSRLNAGLWNRDTVLLAPSVDILGLAPELLRYRDSAGAHRGGTLRLSWDRGDSQEPVLETDDFSVSFGRHPTNRIQLNNRADSRFHGALSLIGTSVRYHHSGTRPAVLSGATRQVMVERNESVTVVSRDRIRFASGTILIEYTAPDLYDPEVLPTSTAGEEGEGDGGRWVNV